MNLRPSLRDALAKLSYSPVNHFTNLIGETRFELATSASRTQRSGQTELLPGKANRKIAYMDLSCKLQ